MNGEKISLRLGVFSIQPGEVDKILLIIFFSEFLVQKRELFTYYGVKALRDFAHATVQITPHGRQAGISPIPVNYNTGTFTVTRDNVDTFLAGKG